MAITCCGDFKTNADFVKENGTQPDVPYVFNRSLLNCYPDEDAIPAEEIEKMAVPLIVSYGSDYCENIACQKFRAANQRSA